MCVYVRGDIYVIDGCYQSTFCKGDLLNNYCEDDVVANVTRFLYACVIMLTYPIECFVAREVCITDCIVMM